MSDKPRSNGQCIAVKRRFGEACLGLQRLHQATPAGSVQLLTDDKHVVREALSQVLHPLLEYLRRALVQREAEEHSGSDVL